jgi:ABC-2 type transport system permease protein
MKNLKRYLKLYLHYASKHIKVMLEYRMDFLIGMFSTIIQQGISIIFLKIIFNNIHVLKGWTFYEILFIFSIAF